jgi:hypothetical protein
MVAQRSTRKAVQNRGSSKSLYLSRFSRRVNLIADAPVLSSGVRSQRRLAKYKHLKIRQQIGFVLQKSTLNNFKMYYGY